MLSAMETSAKAAGIKVTVNDTYTGCAPWLMMYGLGHRDREMWASAHSGHVIAWDLGYWDREQHMRLTIDADHCCRLIHDRPYERRTLTLRDDYKQDGHILLCGMGVKSRAQFRYKGLEWELAKLTELKKLGRRVIYKPKKPEAFPIETYTGTIEKALKGCSLVVCRHSNVAIDACIAGVPVICEDGAGYALYKDNPNPTREQRAQFLRNLSWWNWAPSEALEAWAFIRDVLTRLPDSQGHWQNASCRESGV